MVATTIITQSNALFASQKPVGLVCVFAGATSGIGLATQKAGCYAAIIHVLRIRTIGIFNSSRRTQRKFPGLRIRLLRDPSLADF
jgi:hypothetical protein